jgi:hypothetical protein
MSKAIDSELRTKLSPTAKALLEERLRKARAGVKALPLIGKRAQDGPQPLSCMQEWIWFLIERSQHDTPAPTSDAAYLIPNAVRLKGHLDANALESAFNEVIRRHETLRTSFSTINGQRVQVSAKQLTMKLPTLGLSHLPQDRREAQLQGYIAEELQHPFDLMRRPLLRARLFRLDQEDHVLLVTMHHHIADGWSMGVLTQELSALYQEFSTNQPFTRADLPIQYADYTLWQREWLQSEAAKGQLSYWRKKLDGASFVLNLPTDYPRPTMQSFRGAKQVLIVPGTLTEALKDLSRRSRATLFMTLLAAFNTLLYWFSEQEDILIGTHISGRVSTETEGLIGNLLNILVLRTDLSGNPSFEQLLSRVGETILEAFANQNLPFVKLVQSVQPSPALNRSPVVQVFFLLQNFPASAIDLHGLTSTVMNMGGARGTRDLSLTMTEKDGGLIASLQYDEALFESSTIKRLLSAFGSLLSDIAAHPKAPLLSLQLFGSKYHQRSTD